MKWKSERQIERATLHERPFTLHASRIVIRASRFTPHASRFTPHASRFTPQDGGFALLAFVGILAIMTIMASVLLPNMVTLIDQKSSDAETVAVKEIGKGTAIYLRRNHAWPPALSSLAPDYVPFDSAQLALNPRGYERYLFVHPNTAGFSNAAGLAASALPDVRLLVVSDLSTNAAPVITNATEFETWWGTSETTDLRLFKGNVANYFFQVNLSAMGKGGSYQIDGATTNSGGGTLSNYSRHHVVGTIVSLDEASTYGTPEIQFALTEDVTYVFVPCLGAGQRWRIPPIPPCPVLWISTQGTAAGAPGIGSWEDSELVNFADPNLAYETGSTGHTSGTFGRVMDLEDFTSTTDIDAAHYVGSSMSVGGVALLEGDLLLSTAASETLTSVNSLSVNHEDVFIFRPSSPNDYSSGTFHMLIDGSDIFGDGRKCDEGGMPICDVQAVSLVELPTTVGGMALSPGQFLITGENSGKDVWLFTPTSLGTTTSGTFDVFIDGSDINIRQDFSGIELIEQNTNLGDVTLQAGHILASLKKNDKTVGTNKIAVKSQDVFILDLSSAGSKTVGTATLLFDGSDVGLSGSAENIDAVAINGNGLMSATSITLPIVNPDFETGTLTGWTKTDDLLGTGGSNQWGVVTSATTMSNPHGGAYFASGRATGATGSGAHLTGLSQRVSVSSHATDIDNGLVTATVSGYGFGENGQDYAFIRLRFFNAESGGTQLGSVVDSPAATQSQVWTPLSVNNQTLPAGTRSIEIMLLGNKITNGQYNDTGFDDMTGWLTISY